MAPALTDGVPGLEGVHMLVPPAPADAWSFILNDYEDPTTGDTREWTSEPAWSMLTDIQGLHDRPDSDDPRVNLVFQHGELALPRYTRGRTITYTGIMAAQTLSDMRNWIAGLRACTAAATTYPGGWVMQASYNSTYDPSGLTFLGYGVPIAFTCDDTLPSATALPSPHQRQFVLTFRQADGRWWEASTFAYAGFDYSPIADGTTGTLALDGTAPSEPTFTVVGSGAGSATIVVASVDLTASVTINLPAALNSDDSLVVDFLTRSVTYLPNGGGSDDYTGYIDWSSNNSNWWTEPISGFALLPGASNTVSVTGDTWYATARAAVW